MAITEDTPRDSSFARAVATEAGRDSRDLTGRDSMVRSVVSSWGAHVIFVVAGFVLPRAIDRQLGQTLLGVWDFGWSVVTYFGIAELGVGSSVNRYVAKHRAENDLEGLSRAVSSVVYIHVLAAAAVLVLTGLATYLVPWLLSNRLGAFVSEARWVVALLGTSLAVQIAFYAFPGIVTGCHRWDLHNAINAGFYALTVLGMIISLSLGGGLRSLACATLLYAVISELTRAIVAYQVCPELTIGRRYVNWCAARSMLTFGGKVVLVSLSSLLLYQTTSLIIVKFLGVEALALYSRPLSLVRNANTFVHKFAYVLTPTAGSLQAAGQRDEVRELLLESTRYAAHIALPPALFLSILGGPVLRIWMGPRYEQPGVLAILALGHLMYVTQAPVWNILTGLDKHGGPALAYLGTAILGVVLCVTAVGPLHAGLVGVAAAISLSLAIVQGICIPVYACRQLGLSVDAYAVSAWYRPVVCAIPFALCLVAARVLISDRPVLALIWGAVAGGGVLLLTYWMWVVPMQIRQDVHRRIERTFGRLGWLRS